MSDRLARHLELDRAVALVGQAVREQRFDTALVILLALALEVWAAVAFAGPGGVGADRAFVPVQAQPAQAIEDDVHGGLGVAGGIGVLDAQDECAARMPGVKPVKQRGAGSADVQEARGTGRKTNACFHWASVNESPFRRNSAVPRPPCRGSRPVVPVWYA